jgi:hypothetical protein
MKTAGSKSVNKLMTLWELFSQTYCLGKNNRNVSFTADVVVNCKGVALTEYHHHLFND